MDDKNLDILRKQAEEEFPNEACGLLIIKKGKELYLPCKNVADYPDQDFIISPKDYADAEDQGDIIAIVHTHPNVSAEASQADRISCNTSNKPWYILAWPKDELNYIEPDDFKLPLVGRQFSHGIIDCYTLVQDYYKDTLDIKLDYIPREMEWWDKGQNIYVENYTKQGFVIINNPSDIKEHDAFLIQLISSVPNHAAIYIGEGLIMHHVMG